jgi:hypothetical protein
LLELAYNSIAPAARLMTTRSRVMAQIAGGLVLLFAHEVSAQVQLDRCFPPAIAVGTTSTVKAEGKFPNWPPSIHCDRADVQLVATPTAGELSINVDGSAHPGVAWIRLSDASSASRLVPLMIEPVPVSI